MIGPSLICVPSVPGSSPDRHLTPILMVWSVHSNKLWVGLCGQAHLLPGLFRLYWNQPNTLAPSGTGIFTLLVSIQISTLTKRSI